MKLHGFLIASLFVLAISTVAEARRKTGGSSSRKSTSIDTRRRTPNSSSSSSLGHSGLASLSYPGYNSAPAKKPQTNQQSNPIGWNVPKDTGPKKEISSNVQHSQSSNVQPAHSYPSSGGLSGSQGSSGGHAYPPSGSSGSHAYPANNPSSGQHAYPPSSGLSGTGQRASNPNSPVANAPPAYPGNNPPPYSANNPPAYSANNPPAYSQNNPSYPANRQAYPVNNNPAYPVGHGGYNQPHYGGYGGAPPAYGGYGFPNQGGFGGSGYGGFVPGFGGGYGGMGYGYQKKSSFLSGNTFGAILAGLAVWNLVRSGHKTNNYYNYYYNNGTSGSDGSGPNIPPDPILNELLNCTLTITNSDKADVTLIPCIIVSSFAADAETVKNLNKAAEDGGKDALNCLITLIYKNGTEQKLNMPCADLSKMAPKDNQTAEATALPEALIQPQNCTPGVVTENLQPGDSNSCKVISSTTQIVSIPLAVIPLSSTTDIGAESSTTTITTTTTVEPTSTTHKDSKQDEEVQITTTPEIVTTT